MKTLFFLLGLLAVAFVLLLAFVVLAGQVGLWMAATATLVAIIAAAYASDARQRRRRNLLA